MKIIFFLNISYYDYSYVELSIIFDTSFKKLRFRYAYHRSSNFEIKNFFHLNRSKQSNGKQQI